MLDICDPELDLPVQRCNDEALLQGTAEEVLVWRQRWDRTRRENESVYPILPYIMTEIMTLTFPSRADLVDENTREGGLFADLVQLILKQQVVARLLWGQVIEHPNVYKVALEWQSMKRHDSLHTLPAFRDLISSLTTRSLVSITSNCIHLSDIEAREMWFTNFLGSNYHLQFYEFQLPTRFRDCTFTIVPTSQINSQKIPPSSTDTHLLPIARTFLTHWTQFGMNVYRHHGVSWCDPTWNGLYFGGLSWAGGWLIPRPTTTALPSTSTAGDIFMGIIGSRTPTMSEQILHESQELNYWEGGIADLKSLTSEVNIYHVKFHCLDHGWNGSVTAPYPPLAPGIHRGLFFKPGESSYCNELDVFGKSDKVEEI